jgi:hypothetical protein
MVLVLFLPWGCGGGSCDGTMAAPALTAMVGAACLVEHRQQASTCSTLEVERSNTAIGARAANLGEVYLAFLGKRTCVGGCNDLTVRA